MTNNFYTSVLQRDPRFNSTSICRDIDMLEPVFRRKVVAILNDAKSAGRPLIVVETYRSTQRQQQLFEQGATKLHTVGVHHYGLAADFAWLVGGQASWKPDFSLLGHVAKAHGLIWGGDWGTPLAHHTFIDDDHVQGCTIGQQSALFAGEWYPDPARP